MVARPSLLPAAARAAPIARTADRSLRTGGRSPRTGVAGRRLDRTRPPSAPPSFAPRSAACGRRPRGVGLGALASIEPRAGWRTRR